LNAKMMARSAERFVLVDVSKFGRMATYSVGPLSAATKVIVDAGITPEWRQRLAGLGVNLSAVRGPRETAR
jgi:DeoR family fructose operon transcriptional repressor